MRVYVATKYEERARARQIMDQLETAGHTITYDWTTNEQVNEAQARADMNGVRSAEALVLIVEKDLAYTGSLVELGIALGLRIPVFVIGKALNSRCIFMRLSELRYDIETLLLRSILNLTERVTYNRSHFPSGVVELYPGKVDEAYIRNEVGSATVDFWLKLGVLQRE